MRALIGLVVAFAVVAACGGGASGGYGTPTNAAPAVTSAPAASPAGPGSTYSPDDYGY